MATDAKRWFYPALDLTSQQQAHILIHSISHILLGHTLVKVDLPDVLHFPGQPLSTNDERVIRRNASIKSFYYPRRTETGFIGNMDPEELLQNAQAEAFVKYVIEPTDSNLSIVRGRLDLEERTDIQSDWITLKANEIRNTLGIQQLTYVGDQAW